MFTPVYIEEAKVREILDADTLIALMKDAMIRCSEGTVIQPLRSIHKFPEGKLFGFMPATITNTIAVKGDTIAYEYSASFLKVKVIISDEGIYAYSPTLPFFYVKLEENPLKDADIWTLVKEGANLTQAFIQYIDSYEETVDGVKYYVEEYNDREFVTTKFYFEGETLKFLKVTNSQTLSVQYTYFDNITFEVEDSYFDIPSGAFDLSPILTGLILSILAAA